MLTRMRNTHSLLVGKCKIVQPLLLLNCGAGEGSWESLGLQEIKSVIPKGNHLWIFIGRTNAEAPILWPPDAKSWLTGKDSDAGKDWRQEENQAAEDEKVRQQHHLNGLKLRETVEDRGAWYIAVHGVAKVGHDLVTEQQQPLWKTVWESVTKVDASYHTIQ